MPQVQKSLSTWKRVVQKAAGRDPETNKPVFEFVEHDVTMYREDYGHTSCFAENEQIMRGLRRVHIYSA